MKLVIIGIYFMLMATVAHGQDTFTQGLQPSPGLVRQPQSPRSMPEVTPNPDPTRVTKEAIAEIKQQMLELFGTKFDSVIKEIDRLDRASEKRPNEIRIEIENLEKLVAEKFNAVAQQFDQNNKNLDTALAAQKDKVADQNLSNTTAANKAENNFKDQISGIQSLLVQQDKASADKIDDIKARLQAIESQREGQGQAVDWVVIAGGLVLTLVSIVSGVAALVAVVRSGNGHGNGNAPATVQSPVVYSVPPPVSRRK